MFHYLFIVIGEKVIVMNKTRNRSPLIYGPDISLTCSERSLIAACNVHGFERFQVLPLINLMRVCDLIIIYTPPQITQISHELAVIQASPKCPNRLCWVSLTLSACRLDKLHLILYSAVTVLCHPFARAKFTPLNNSTINRLKSTTNMYNLHFP